MQDCTFKMFLYIYIYGLYQFYQKHAYFVTNIVKSRLTKTKLAKGRADGFSLLRDISTENIRARILFFFLILVWTLSIGFVYAQRSLSQELSSSTMDYYVVAFYFFLFFLRLLFWIALLLCTNFSTHRMKYWVDAGKLGWRGFSWCFEWKIPTFSSAQCVSV